MRKFFITNKISSDVAEIYVYGYIDPCEVNAGDFVKELRELEKQYANINVRINSYGGSVFEGLAMYNAMRQSKANIETYIDGVAASMASVLMLGGKKVHMSRSARVMTHKPSSWGAGTSEDLRNDAELLDGLEDTMAAIYSGKTGKTVADCKTAFMNGKDNWFDSKAAIDAKLVDRVYDAPVVDIPEGSKDVKSVWSIYNQQKFAAVFNQQNTNMKNLSLSPTAMAAMKLSDSSDQAAFETAVAALIEKANKADTLTAQVATLQTQNTSLQTEVANLKNASVIKTVSDMLEQALNVDKKITVEMKNQLAKDYKDNPDGLKLLLAALPSVQPITSQMKVDNASDLVNKTWKELDAGGKLEELKASNPDVFFDKFKAHFGKKHPEDKRA